MRHGTAVLLCDCDYYRFRFFPSVPYMMDVIPMTKEAEQITMVHTSIRMQKVYIVLHGKYVKGTKSCENAE